MDGFAAYERKRDRLVVELKTARVRGAPVALRKSTSNLFRQRKQSGVRKLDVRQFNRVLRVDPERMTAEVEGMTTYEEFVNATISHGLLPAVVPQLKTITVGGAVSGIGIESSSFRYGLVHETVEEMEVLLGDGRIVVCSPDEHSDLFYGFPNSYGTLGYVLRLRVRLIPTRRYVRLTHQRVVGIAQYFARIVELANDSTIDYLDGVVFGPEELYVTTGEFRDSASRVSDYTYMGVYYKSIREKRQDWLSTAAYIWRWDTDWFWCSKQFGAQNPLVRMLLTRRGLNSRTYQRIMRLAQRLLPGSEGSESVIQDVDIPIENAEQFLHFLLAEIGIRPIWICPFRAFDPNVSFTLYRYDPGKLYVNFGFWDTIRTTHEAGFFNRKVEQAVLQLKGMKGLYSTSFFDVETFWKIYNKPYYDELKREYDPDGVFLGLYEKCVERR